MSASKSLRRYVALLPAVLLVAGFVSYRAGAFNRYLAPAPQPAPQASPEDPPTGNDPQQFMYGSKSAPAFTPAPVPTGNPPQPEKLPTFMGGSKYITITGTTIGLTPAEPQPGANPPPDPAPKPVPNAPVQP